MSGNGGADLVPDHVGGAEQRRRAVAPVFAGGDPSQDFQAQHGAVR